MNKFDKNKKPDKEIIEFIQGFMQISKIMFGSPIAVPIHNDLISNTATKMAKDLGNLENLSTESECKKECQYYTDLLVNWIANGWINDPTKMKIEGYFSNPKNVCPNCGWKSNFSNKNKKKITTCFNCQTGMIYAEDRWFSVNNYIDPKGFCLTALFGNINEEIRKIEKIQDDFLKIQNNQNNINDPLGSYNIIQEWKRFIIDCQIRRNWNEGMIAIIKALNLDPLDINLWHDLITFGFNSGFIYIAYVASKIVIESDPSDISTKSNFERIFGDKNVKFKLFLQGFANSYKKQYVKALSFFYTCLEFKIQPDIDPLVMYGLGYTYFHLFEFDKALPYFEETIKNKSNHPSYPPILFSTYFKIGQIKIFDKKFKEGLKFLKKAIKAQPNDEIIEKWIRIAEKCIKKPKNYRTYIMESGIIREFPNWK